MIFCRFLHLVISFALMHFVFLVGKSMGVNEDLWKWMVLPESFKWNKNPLFSGTYKCSIKTGSFAAVAPVSNIWAASCAPDLNWAQDCARYTKFMENQITNVHWLVSLENILQTFRHSNSSNKKLLAGKELCLYFWNIVQFNHTRLESMYIL